MLCANFAILQYMSYNIVEFAKEESMLHFKKSQKALTAVTLHGLQLLGEVDDDIVIVEEGGEGSVDDLGGERRVWTNVGEEEGGAERFILLLDL